MAAVATLLGALASAASAQAPDATRTFDNAQFRFSIAVPAGCRHDEGPGTIDAICAGDLGAEASATANTNSALLLQIGAQALTGGAGRTGSELASAYSESAFRDELPEAVCGEEKGRVKIDNVQQVLETARVVYTADVTCSEVKFLQLGERRAAVRYVIDPEVQYRLVARAPKDEFQRQKAVVEAFFASFRAVEAGK